MLSGRKIIKNAETQIGEKGRKYCKAYGYHHIVDWCTIFVWWVFRKSGADRYMYKTASVPVLDSWLRKHAFWITDTRNAKEGDIVIFTWSTKCGYNTRTGSRDHAGLVVDYDRGVLRTIEGNTGSKYASDSKVNYRNRYPVNIYAIYRVHFKDDENIDLETMVKNTLSGKYGNGAERKKKLGKNYTLIQKEVNRITELTNETLAGKYGNGAERKEKLGSDYNMVQWNINRIKGV